MSNENPGHDGKKPLFVFPEFHNRIPLMLAPVLALAPIGLIGAIWYYFSPSFTDVGYQPDQPVPYSHKLHAGDLGIDCRYCHVGVEKGPHAGVPPTQTCMNCHASVKKDSPLLTPVRESWTSGESMQWVRIHKAPDYVYFDHSAHIRATIGCEACHGRIDQAVVVKQEQPLSMSWCLECHKAPENYLRPRGTATVMGYKPEGGDQLALGTKLKKENNINPPINCSGCHR